MGIITKGMGKAYQAWKKKKDIFIYQQWSKFSEKEKK